MTRADRVHSTQPTNTTTDATGRGFLSQAAGGTVLALAASSPVPAAAAPASPLDSIYGVIEAHRTAAADWGPFLKAHGHLEDMPDDVRCCVLPPWGPLASWSRRRRRRSLACSPGRYTSNEVRQAEEWLFEEEGAALVATLVEALGNLTVAT
jgi:hypothetical protein